MPPADSARPDDPIHVVYIGCYTAGSGGAGDGIVVADRDVRTGALRRATTTTTPSPSFVVRHPSLPMLYAVNELDEGRLSAFSIGTGGALAPAGSVPTGGALPCHLSFDRGHVLAANYGTGSVAVVAVDRQGRFLRRTGLTTHRGRGPDPGRQEGPHAHMVRPYRDRVLVVDLGLDTVYAYRLDPGAGTLAGGTAVITTAAGAGPRHLAIGAGVLHLVGELNGMVMSYVESGGEWREIGCVAASRHGAVQPSELLIAGDFLYVANRGPDTIATFSLAGGPPVYVGEVPSGGHWPRHMVFIDDFLYVANERSHSVVVLRLDRETGMPAPAGAALETPSPTCVLPQAVSGVRTAAASGSLEG